MKAHKHWKEWGTVLLVLPLTLAVVSVGKAEAASDGARIANVRCPPTGGTNAFYVSNRPPLEPSPFCKLPIGAIAPRGWLRHMLELEAEGMSGHLDEVSLYCRSDGNGWLNTGNPRAYSNWEELPYWLKGFGDLGYVLKDERVTKEARKWIGSMLSSSQPDGWFGPIINKTRSDGKPDVWPNMMALDILQSFHEATGDKRVIEVMTKYFRWELSVPEKDFLVSWSQARAGDNTESVYWLYNRTGDPWLLDLAKKIHAHTERWSEGEISGHGVNFAQGFREPAIYWMQAREPKFREAAYRNYDKFMGEFGQQPGGTFGADEGTRAGYTDPRQATETCAIVEYMHSFEMLLKITGDPLWADRCEEIAFNSLPAAQTPDLKGLHYLTAANEPRLDIQDHYPGFGNGGNQIAYDPFGYRCCQHNVAMGWPYYAEELWLATADNGLCASLYADCEITAKAGDGATVTITEATDYPFSEQIVFTISAPRTARFPLYLRIPRWCKDPKITLNGTALAAQAQPLSYLVVERRWDKGDTLVLDLPARLAVRVWEKNKNAVSVDLGPLTFSLKIGEQWRKYNDHLSLKWPAFEVLPTTPWNYGLDVDPARAEDSIQVIRKSESMPQQPFTPQAAPIELRAKARKIPQWTYDATGLCAVLQASPVYTTEPQETVTLIPMGCARLRIAAFPVAGTSPDAHHWKTATTQPGGDK